MSGLAAGLLKSSLRQSEVRKLAVLGNRRFFKHFDDFVGSREEPAGIDFLAIHATPRNRHTTMPREKPNREQRCPWTGWFGYATSLPFDGSFSLISEVED